MPCGNCKLTGHNRRTCNENIYEDQNITYDIIDQCIVCYEDVIQGGNGSVKTNCGHIYCVNCFAQHMRRNNNCGYCRQELTKKIIKKTLTVDEKNGLVIDSLLTTNTFKLIYSDFLLQAHNLLNNIPFPIKKEDIPLIKETCLSILGDIQLDYCLWMAGTKVCDRVSYEYENNN
jgi:hypothetical protein